MTTDRLRLLARGLLVGEGLSWPDAGYRLRLLNPKRLARMEVLAQFNREHGTTTPPVPYSHSSPVSVLQPGAGEVTEWFAFAAQEMRAAAESGELAAIDRAWIAAAETAGPARIGTHIPLENLKRGLEPPRSGNDNPHYFDDLPLARAVAAAAVFEDAVAAREAARRDAGVTGALDGVWCAEATALLFSALLAGRPVAEAIEAALSALPEETWSRRVALEALAAAAESTGSLDRGHRLSTRVGDWIYSYATVAPETLGMLLGHLSVVTSADDLMLGVLAQPRNAATLPALAGAAASVLFGDGWMPDHLTLDAPLTGISLPAFAGLSLVDALTAA